MNEEQYNETVRRIKIIRNNQKYSGLQDFPEIQDSLKKVAESLICASENKTMPLGNMLSLITTNQSIIDIQVKKLMEQYRIEGEKLKAIIEQQ